MKRRRRKEKDEREREQWRGSRGEHREKGEKM